MNFSTTVRLVHPFSPRAQVGEGLLGAVLVKPSAVEELRPGRLDSASNVLAKALPESPAEQRPANPRNPALSDTREGGGGQGLFGQLWRFLVVVVRS